VWDILRAGDCSSNCILRGDTSLGHGIVARIKVFAILLNLAQDVLVSGELPIEAKELLLLLGHRAEVDLLALERVHCE